jgi:hypothetical protein
MNPPDPTPLTLDPPHEPDSPLLYKARQMFRDWALKHFIDENNPPPKRDGESDSDYLSRVKKMMLQALGYEAMRSLVDRLEAEAKREAREDDSHIATRDKKTRPIEVHVGPYRTHRSKYDTGVMAFVGVLVLVLVAGTVTTMGGVFEKGLLGSTLLLASLAAIPFAIGLMIPKVMGAVALTRDAKQKLLLWMTILAAIVFAGSIGLYPFAFGDAIAAPPTGSGGGNPFPFGDLSGEVVEQQDPVEVYKPLFITSLIVLDALLGGILALFFEIKVYDRRERETPVPAERKKLNELAEEHRATSQAYQVAAIDGHDAMSKATAEAERVAAACLKAEKDRVDQATAVALAAKLGLTLHDNGDPSRRYPLFQSA